MGFLGRKSEHAQQVRRLEIENQQLHDEIYKLRSELESMRMASKPQNNKQQQAGQLKTLMEIENINLKLGLQDIQYNLANTVETARETVAEIDIMIKELEEYTRDTIQHEPAQTESIANIIHQHTSNVAAISDDVFMTLAKVDHLLWKANTYLSISNKEPAVNFVDHHNCRLGKWYYQGNGKQFFSSSSSYSELELPHAMVHNATKSVFTELEQEEIDYTAVAHSIEDMEQASHTVFEILDRISKDKKPDNQ